MLHTIQAAPQAHHFKKPKSGNQDHSVQKTSAFQVISIILLIILSNCSGSSGSGYRSSGGSFGGYSSGGSHK